MIGVSVMEKKAFGFSADDVKNFSDEGRGFFNLAALQIDRFRTK